MSRIRVRDIVKAIEEFAPWRLAEAWDNVGLLIGSESGLIRSALIALDVTSETITEARRARANAIISHHPLIFRPLASLRTSDPVARLAVDLVRADIAHIAAHTNLDNAAGGLNDRLAEMLGIHVETALVRGEQSIPASERSYKLITFVPLDDWERVRDAMAEAGAGIIGNYTHCSFRVRGIGTFLPRRGAAPALGSVGTLEQVEEFRLEVTVPQHRIDDVIFAMRTSHPYEEVAFDVVPLENPCNAGQCGLVGAGRVGMLRRKITLGSLARRVLHTLRPRHLRLVGNPNSSVERVAICTGSGASLIDHATATGADVLITGDVKHHDALRAQELGLAVVDPGHASSEKHAVDLLAEKLNNALPALKVVRSQVPVEPFR